MFYSYRRVLDHFSQYDQPLNPKQEILKRYLAEKRNCVFMTFKTEK